MNLQPNPTQNKIKPWLKRIGVLGFLFFLVKGLFWLFIVASELIFLKGYRPQFGFRFAYPDQGGEIGLQWNDLITASIMANVTSFFDAIHVHFSTMKTQAPTVAFFRQFRG